MEDLYKKYNYPALAKFRKILKTNNISVNVKDTKEFIANQVVAQLHKPVKYIKEKSKFVVALYPYEMIQIDLLDYQKYHQQNKGYNYILIGIDIFTRKAFASLIKNKTPECVKEGFEKFNIEPYSIYHDSGKEFLGVF